MDFSKKSFFIPLILLILTIPIFSSLLRPGFYPMQDDLQAFRIQQMSKCLLDLQIPCRWIPDMGYQYGYPQFNYYPPSVFYLGAIIYFAGFQIIDSVKILFIFGSVFSTLTMFFFLKSFFSFFALEKRKIIWPSFVGALLYSYIPYKATEIYVRGSLSEFFSFVFFPLIFWFSFEIIQKDKSKYIPFLAIATALLLITHNLMSFIFFPVCAIWCLSLMAIWKKWKNILKLGLAFLLGLGLAAFFTLPVLFEAKYVHLETLTGGYFDYRQHFVTFYQLFFSNNFGYGSSFIGSNDDLSLSTGIIQWIAALLAVVFSIVNFKRDKKLSILIFIFAFVELFVLFLTHQRSSFIWEKIPSFLFLQFPWRFLSNSTFLLSFMGAVFIFLLRDYKRNTSIFVGVFILIAIFILYSSFFQPKSWVDITDAEKFSGSNWEKQLTISIFDYLPIYAKLPPKYRAPELPETLDGKLVFLGYKKGSNYQSGQVKVFEDAQIRIPLFDFPGMEVKIDGKVVEHSHNDCRKQEFCLGLINFKIPQGEHNFIAMLKDTPIRRVGNIITLISIFIISGLIFNNKNEKTI